MTRTLMVVLIAACALNWLQVQRLQAQVAELQINQRQMRSASAAPSASITKPISAAKKITPEAPLGLTDLSAQWKHLWNRAGAFRTAKEKAFFHEHPI